MKTRERSAIRTLFVIKKIKIVTKNIDVHGRPWHDIIRKEEDMKISELAELMVATGTLLTGIGSVIIAIKKEPKERKPRKAVQVRLW